MNLDERIQALYNKLSTTVALTENILDGFDKTWMMPGCGAAMQYIRAAEAAGRLSELLTGVCDTPPWRLKPLIELSTSNAPLLNQLISAANDAQKEQICDIMRIPK